MKRLTTLRIRFALWTAGLLLAALTLFGIFVYVNMARSLTTVVDGTLQGIALQMVEEGGSRGAVSISDFEDPQYAHLHEQGLSMRLFDPATQLRQTYGPYTSLPQPPVSQAFLTGAGLYTTINDPATQTAVRLYTMPINAADGRTLGILQVVLDLNSVNKTLDLLAVTLLIAIPVIGMVAGAGGYFLAARALLRIDRITQTAGTLSAQDLSARLNLPKTNDEVGRLAATFDLMLARLDDAFRRERQFTADASHELRTPLSAMQMIIDSTVTQPRTATEYVQALTDLRQETEVMHSLTEGLLQLARSDVIHQSFVMESVRVALLLQDVVESLRFKAEEKGLALYDHVTADETTISGDSDALIRLFVNLLDNAIKYTEKGSITVNAGWIDGHYRIEICDTGIGILPVHLPHLFDRFYRVDPARSRQGIGLGLAIAQSIVSAHGGTITVESAVGVGSTFMVHLPAVST